MDNSSLGMKRKKELGFRMSKKDYLYVPRYKECLNFNWVYRPNNHYYLFIPIVLE